MLHNTGVAGIGESGRLNLHAKHRETKQNSRMMMMMNKMLKQQRAAQAHHHHHHHQSLLSTLNNNEIGRLRQQWMKMKPMEHGASSGGLNNDYHQASAAAVAQLGDRTHHLLRNFTPRFRTGNTTKHHRRSPDRLIGYGRPYGGGGGGYPPLIPTTKNSYSIWSRAQFQDQLSRFPTLAKWCPKTILPNGTHVWQYPNHAPSVLCITK